jgi:Pyruvate/2-oxoacid:ferredoxin oxidoreductase delta subunit
MNYGIYDIKKVAKNEEIVKCNNCSNYFYEDITDERNNNSLELFSDNGDFFKGCPKCKTDDFLINVN